MQLITAVAAGVRGAEDGFVRVYRRGTSTRATWYASFEATAPDSSGDDIPLDGNGGATIYVNELVNVVVLDPDGETVRSFVEGEASPVVEVISPSFTGTNYADGATGTNKPTTLQAALDLLLTSFGSPDFKVLFNGASQTLQTALASQLTFINVKSPTYGAVGDGVADDTAAINAALTAGSTAGTVFFPAGTYKVTAGLTIPASVNLLGVGLSIIAFSHATQNALTITGEGTVIENMAVIAVGAISGNMVHLSTAGAWVTLRSCVIQSGSGAALATASAGLAGHTKLIAIDSNLSKALSGTPVVNAVFSDANSQCSLIGCEISVTTAFAASSDSLVRMSYGSVIGCKLNLSNNASGTLYGVRAPAVEPLQALTVVSGCSFFCTGGAGTMYLFGIGSSGAISDAGNTLGSGYTAVYSGRATSNAATGTALTTIQGNGHTTWSSGNLTLPFDLYSFYEVNFNFDFAAAGKTMSFATDIAPGRFLVLTLTNASGGAVTFSYPTNGGHDAGAVTATFPAPFAIANGKSITMVFLTQNVGGFVNAVGLLVTTAPGYTA